MQTRVLLYLAVLLFYFALPVEGCMKVGISAKATYAIIGACVIFSPILLVGGAGYAAVVGTKYGVEKAKQTNRNRQSKKRTSNLLGKQRNRMVKKVGAQNFDRYLQDMFDKCKLQVDADSFLELATALFFNNDLTASLHWLNKALAAKQSGWDKTGHTHFVRGLVNQYLFDFEAAVADYSVAQSELPSSAPEQQQEGAAVPILTVADAMNAKGYAKMQTALYSDGDGYYLENRKYVDEETRLKLLTASIADISSAINNSDELQGMFYHNRGYSRYHKSIYLQDPQEKEQELLRAIEDYDTAIGSGNFGTTAEAHAMKSQALAMLKRMDEAGEEARIAEELDSKVFLVNLQDENELKAPWPLPRDKYKGQNTLHYFSENTFLRPHYCDCCSQLIMPGVSYSCYKCGLRAHKQCHPKVKGKDCWGSLHNEYIDKMMDEYDKETSEKEEKEENEENEAGHQHTHHLRATHFHKPTWCNLCLKFIASPIGKQGFQCVDCNVKLHKNCLAMAGKYFIEDNNK